jgi:hypothetical protein
MTNIVGDIWECAVEFALNQERGTVVFHKEVVVVNESLESVMGADLANELNTLSTSSNSSFLGLDAFVVCATARRVPPADVTRTFVEFGVQTKSILAEAVAAQSSMLFSMYPDPGGEITSGRNFIPFLMRDQAVSGQILQASKADILTSFSTWLLDLIEITSGDLKPVLYRYATDIDPAVIVDIAEMILQPVLASQRRRVQHHQPFSS